MNPHIKKKLKKILTNLKVKKEASTTGTGPVATGGVMMGGDAARTPFAFSKRGARPSTYTQLGYKLAKPVKRSPGYKLENQMYSEPAYSTPAQNIEPVDTYKDQYGLVQHGDPELDPGLAGHEQGQLPMYESSFKKLMEGINGLKYEQEEPVQTQPPQVQQPSTKQPSTQSNVNVQSYDVLPDFTAFDTKLKNSTESLKNNLQKIIQDKILGKKIVVRASKGYKQPETDYTINVTGVAIDYYYDRYVIIIIGREENKQKVAKFFIKPGFSIKILGSADLKPKDQYQVAKSKALVSPQQSATPTNKITGDENQKDSSTKDETPETSSQV